MLNSHPAKNAGTSGSKALVFRGDGFNPPGYWQVTRTLKTLKDPPAGVCLYTLFYFIISFYKHCIRGTEYLRKYMVGFFFKYQCLCFMPPRMKIFSEMKSQSLISQLHCKHTNIVKEWMYETRATSAVLTLVSSNMHKHKYTPPPHTHTLGKGRPEVGRWHQTLPARTSEEQAERTCAMS